MKNKIIMNSAWIIGVKIVQSIISLAIGMLTARYLGPSDYGLINYATSIVAFVTPIMQLGITNILVQYIVLNKDKDGQVLGSAMTLCFISSILCIVGVTAFSAIVDAGENETILVCFLYSLSLMFQSVEIIQYWFQAKLLSKHISIATLIAYIVIAIYRILLLMMQKSVRWFVLSYAADYMLVSVALLYKYYKMGGQRLRFSKKIAYDMLSKGKYYIVSSMMVVIFAQTDKIMLKMMIGNTAVGYYSAAVVIAGMTSFVFSAIMDSFRPVILEKKKEDERAFNQYMMTLFGIVIYMSLAQSVVVSVMPEFIVNIIYGSEYKSTASALRIVVWYTTFAYLGYARNIWILAEEKQKYLWILNMSGALGNVLLNAVLIPLWGINGAALASLITQIFTNVIMNHVIKPIRPVNKLMLDGVSILKLLEILKIGKITGRESK